MIAEIEMGVCDCCLIVNNNAVAKSFAIPILNMLCGTKLRKNTRKLPTRFIKLSLRKPRGVESVELRYDKDENRYVVVSSPALRQFLCYDGISDVFRLSDRQYGDFPKQIFISRADNGKKPN